MKRRRFICRAGAAGGLLALGSPEERILLAQRARQGSPSLRIEPGRGLPGGRIGTVQLSRLIYDGNLLNGFAHRRDLTYMSDHLGNYFTDDKCVETLMLAAQSGMTAAVLDAGSDTTYRILARLEHAGVSRFSWIARCAVPENDPDSVIARAVDHGAEGAFIRGTDGDRLVERNRLDLVERALDAMRDHGLIAGVGSHTLAVPRAVEASKLAPDFYFKTLNEAGCMCGDFKETVSYMATVRQPWVAFKVLGAGVIDPRRGFRTAFEGGADYIAVEMFDFQIAENVHYLTSIFRSGIRRERPWM